MAPTRIREGIKLRKTDPAEAIVDAFDRPLLLLPQVRRPETVLAASHKPEPLEDYTGAVWHLNLHRSRRLLDLHHWNDIRLVLTLSQRQIPRQSGAVIMVSSDHGVEVDIEGEVPSRGYVAFFRGTQVPPIRQNVLGQQTSLINEGSHQLSVSVRQTSGVHREVNSDWLLVRLVQLLRLELESVELTLR